MDSATRDQDGSGDTVLEKHFDVFTEPNGDRWMVITSIVTAPRQPHAALRGNEPLQAGGRRQRLGPNFLPRGPPALSGCLIEVPAIPERAVRSMIAPRCRN